MRKSASATKAKSHLFILHNVAEEEKITLHSEFSENRHITDLGYNHWCHALS